MTKQQFDSTSFKKGMKAVMVGEDIPHLIEGVDFNSGMICIDDTWEYAKDVELYGKQDAQD